MAISHKELMKRIVTRMLTDIANGKKKIPHKRGYNEYLKLKYNLSADERRKLRQKRELEIRILSTELLRKLKYI